MRLDLHTHSRYSPDSKLEPIEIVKAAKQRGFDGVAITDHNAIEGSRLAWEYGRANGFLVIRGAEISRARLQKLEREGQAARSDEENEPRWIGFTAS